MGAHGFTEEQREFAKAVRDFAAKECGTREQRDALTDHGAEQHNQGVYEKLANAGYVGVSIPEEYGGSGGGITEQVILFEELWRGMVPVHGAGTSHTVAGVYKRFATEEQKKAMLGAICTGEVMSISISEPGAGSDAAAISCKAERVADGFRINGQKTWCSDAQFASTILLVARTARGARPHDGLTMFEIPADAPGLEIRPIQTMAGAEVNDLFLTDLVVPESAVVGEEGGAWKQVMAGLNGERIVCAAQGLGMAQPAGAVRRPDRLVPGGPAPYRRPCHRDRGLSRADLRHDAPRRQRDGHARGAGPGHVHGEGQGHRDREEGGARGHSAHGRVRLHPGVRHGAASPAGHPADDLRRHERDPARHHLRQLRSPPRAGLSLAEAWPSHVQHF